jgi:putative OPT family oligopeptide transporter
MLTGGILGVLFVIIIRRALVEDRSLPFPESVACGEIVKAGQKGQTGARYVFSTLGLGIIIEFFKNPRGLQLFGENFAGFFTFAKSKIQLLKGTAKIGASTTFGGGLFLESPLASPALMGVGYIIGPKLAAITFSGGIFGWLLLIPLALFMNPNLEALIGSEIILEGNTHKITWADVGAAVYNAQVKPIAVGAMLVGAFFTLWRMRSSLFHGIARAIKDMQKAKAGGMNFSRLQHDFSFKWVGITIACLCIPIFLLYQYFTNTIGGAIVGTIVMVIAGFLFAAVAGYLVGVIGSSSNPVSGLTLSTLLIAALLMVILGIRGNAGIAAVLGVAAVVCCAAAIAGDMIQDLKVGHILGGTPWKMELGEIIGVICAALVMVFPILVLHQGTPGGIGGEHLPAPQAGLMAAMSQGIVTGQMPWPLIIVGMMFSVGLIMLGAPSPMLIAVGMYLPFHTTAAIFVGGVIRWIYELYVKKQTISAKIRERAENIGILLASGFVAGEALTGVLLAALYVGDIRLPTIGESPYGGLLIFVIVALVLIWIPLKKLALFQQEAKG